MKLKSLIAAGVLAFGIMGAASPTLATVRMFVRQEVADYAAWRAVYNDFEPTQFKMGVVFKAVFQSTDDPNDVTFFNDFRTVEEAKSFAASTEFKTTMEKGGAKGKPQIWYVTKRIK